MTGDLANLASDRAVGRRTWEEFLADRVSSSSDSTASLPDLATHPLIQFLVVLLLLALVGLLARHSDRSVRQHNPTMNPCQWRGCA